MSVSLEQPMRPYLKALGESLDNTDASVAQLAQDVQTLDGELDDTNTEVGAIAQNVQGLQRQLYEITLEYVRTYDTVTEMQADDNLISGMVCHTNGFYATGDGGAAYYTVGTTGTANGMDVLALQNSLYATLVVTEPYVTPEMFGAWGDGTHDDTASIQVMLDNSSCTTYDGMNKTYLLSDINIDTANRTNGLRVSRSARIFNFKVKIASDVSDYFTPFNIISGDSIIFENVSIDGTHVGTHTGIQDGGLSGIKTESSFYGSLIVSCCKIENCYTDGLQLRYNTKLTLQDSNISNCGRNGVTANCANVSISNCVFDSNGYRTSPRSAIHVEPDGDLNIEAITIHDCQFYNTANIDIKIDVAPSATLHIKQLTIYNVLVDNVTAQYSVALSQRENLLVDTISIKDCFIRPVNLRTGVDGHLGKLNMENIETVPHLALVSGTDCKEAVFKNCMFYRSVYIYASVSKCVFDCCHWDCEGSTVGTTIAPCVNEAGYTDFVFTNCTFDNVAWGIIHKAPKSLILDKCTHNTRSGNVVPANTVADFIIVNNCKFTEQGSVPSFNLGDENTTPLIIVGSMFYRSNYYTGANVQTAANIAIN